MICKILVDYGASEGWKVGDIVDIDNPIKLIAEGKVEEYVKTVSDNTDGKVAKPKRSGKKSKKTDL
jgi:hypothetical protein